MPNEKFEAAVMNWLLALAYLFMICQVRKEIKNACDIHGLPGLKAAAKEAGILAEDD